MLSRTAARRALTASRTLPLRNPTLSRRSLSTAPPAKKRSWKGTAFRWGLAGAGLYYYATSDVFAQEEEGTGDSSSFRFFAFLPFPPFVFFWPVRRCHKKEKEKQNGDKEKEGITEEGERTDGWGGGEGRTQEVWDEEV
jgi:hypothetical protein